MKKLIIISDLWGFGGSEWLFHYVDSLLHHYDITFLDSADLARICPSEKSQEVRHTHFLNGGIDASVDFILDNYTDEVDVLGFSIGGFIAWKAGLKGLKIKNLTAISSTRLRFESIKPTCNLFLYYGKEDPHCPNSDWFKKLDIGMNVYNDEKHDLYTQKGIIVDLCSKMIGQ